MDTVRFCLCIYTTSIAYAHKKKSIQIRREDLLDIVKYLGCGHADERIEEDQEDDKASIISIYPHQAVQHLSRK